MSQEEMIRSPISLDAAVRINQLPEIEDQLRTIRDWVLEVVAKAKDMECSEENLQEVKANRAFLNSMRAEFDKKHKEILERVEAPIKRYKATYKECISDIFADANVSLGNAVLDVQDRMKGRCEQLLRSYFDELTQTNGIGFLKYEQTGVTVSMTDVRVKNQPPKNLRDQLEKFVLRVGQDVDTILSLENADEILSVYKHTLNVTDALQIVNDRRRQIEQAKEEQERRNSVKAQEAEAAQRVAAFAPPVVSEPAPKQEETLTVAFTITDTRERLKLLKQFLDTNGFKYT